MFSLAALIQHVRKHNARRSAITTLRGLSASQLSDLGLPEDGLGEVVDAMLARAETRPVTPRVAPPRLRAPGVVPAIPQACG